jgi:hypothetical protein
VKSLLAEEILGVENGIRAAKGKEPGAEAPLELIPDSGA